MSEELSNKLVSAIQRAGDLPHEGLSKRELQVLQLLVQGKTVKQVGIELGLSIKTVSTHRNRILGKLESHTTAELVRYALKSGILVRDSQSVTS